MADLYINDVDALEAFGVRMGDKFLDNLGAPSPMKANIENDNRSTNGKQIFFLGALDSRQLNLEFTIQGDTAEDFRGKRDAFYQLLYNGEISIHVPQNGPEVYHLVYIGVSPTYSQSRSQCFCRVMVRFEEPNPTNRS